VLAYSDSPGGVAKRPFDAHIGLTHMSRTER
jgi:hypothetical protein